LFAIELPFDIEITELGTNPHNGFPSASTDRKFQKDTPFDLRKPLLEHVQWLDKHTRRHLDKAVPRDLLYGPLECGLCDSEITDEHPRIREWRITFNRRLGTGVDVSDSELIALNSHVNITSKEPAKHHYSVV
jgi:hypothetical protein